MPENTLLELLTTGGCEGESEGGSKCGSQLKLLLENITIEENATQTVKNILREILNNYSCPDIYRLKEYFVNFRNEIVRLTIYQNRIKTQTPVPKDFVSHGSGRELAYIDEIIRNKKIMANRQAREYKEKFINPVNSWTGKMNRWQDSDRKTRKAAEAEAKSELANTEWRKTIDRAEKEVKHIDVVNWIKSADNAHALENLWSADTAGFAELYSQLKLPDSIDFSEGCTKRIEDLFGLFLSGNRSGFYGKAGGWLVEKVAGERDKSGTSAFKIKELIKDFIEVKGTICQPSDPKPGLCLDQKSEVKINEIFGILNGLMKIVNNLITYFNNMIKDHEKSVPGWSLSPRVMILKEVTGCIQSLQMVLHTYFIKYGISIKILAPICPNDSVKFVDWKPAKCRLETVEQMNMDALVNAHVTAHGKDMIGGGGKCSRKDQADRPECEVAMSTLQDAWLTHKTAVSPDAAIKVAGLLDPNSPNGVMKYICPMNVGTMEDCINPVMDLGDGTSINMCSAIPTLDGNLMCTPKEGLCHDLGVGEHCKTSRGLDRDSRDFYMNVREEAQKHGNIQKTWEEKEVTDDAGNVRVIMDEVHTLSGYAKETKEQLDKSDVWGSDAVNIHIQSLREKYNLVDGEEKAELEARAEDDIKVGLAALRERGAKAAAVAAEQKRQAAEKAKEDVRARLAAEKADQQARLAAEKAQKAEEDEQARLAAEKAEEDEQARLATEKAAEQARVEAPVVNILNTIAISIFDPILAEQYLVDETQRRTDQHAPEGGERTGPHQELVPLSQEFITSELDISKYWYNKIIRHRSPDEFDKFISEETQKLEAALADVTATGGVLGETVWNNINNVKKNLSLIEPYHIFENDIGKFCELNSSLCSIPCQKYVQEVTQRQPPFAYDKDADAPGGNIYARLVDEERSALQWLFGQIIINSILSEYVSTNIMLSLTQGISPKIVKKSGAHAESVPTIANLGDIQVKVEREPYPLWEGSDQMNYKSEGIFGNDAWWYRISNTPLRYNEDHLAKIGFTDCTRCKQEADLVEWETWPCLPNIIWKLDSLLGYGPPVYTIEEILCKMVMAPPGKTSIDWDDGLAKLVEDIYNIRSSAARDSEDSEDYVAVTKYNKYINAEFINKGNPICLGILCSTGEGEGLGQKGAVEEAGHGWLSLGARETLRRTVSRQDPVSYNYRFKIYEFDTKTVTEDGKPLWDELIGMVKERLKAAEVKAAAARAKELLERALAIEEAAYGEDHVNVALTLGNLGLAYADLGDVARAKELYERALAIKEAAEAKAALPKAAAEEVEAALPKAAAEEVEAAAAAAAAAVAASAADSTTRTYDLTRYEVGEICSKINTAFKVAAKEKQENYPTDYAPLCTELGYTSEAHMRSSIDCGKYTEEEWSYVEADIKAYEKRFNIYQVLQYFLPDGQLKKLLLVSSDTSPGLLRIIKHLSRQLQRLLWFAKDEAILLSDILNIVGSIISFFKKLKEILGTLSIAADGPSATSIDVDGNWIDSNELGKRKYNSAAAERWGESSYLGTSAAGILTARPAMKKILSEWIDPDGKFLDKTGWKDQGNASWETWNNDDSEGSWNYGNYIRDLLRDIVDPIYKLIPGLKAYGINIPLLDEVTMALTTQTITEQQGGGSGGMLDIDAKIKILEDYIINKRKTLPKSIINDARNL